MGEEFNKRIIELFDKLQPAIESRILEAFHAIDISNGDSDSQSMGLKAPSSTWAYLVNDDPFRNMPELQPAKVPAIYPEALLFTLVIVSGSNSRLIFLMSPAGWCIATALGGALGSRSQPA